MLLFFSVRQHGSYNLCPLQEYALELSYSDKSPSPRTEVDQDSPRVESGSEEREQMACTTTSSER